MVQGLIKEDGYDCNKTSTVLNEVVAILVSNVACQNMGTWKKLGNWF